MIDSATLVGTNRLPMQAALAHAQFAAVLPVTTPARMPGTISGPGAMTTHGVDGVSLEPGRSAVFKPSGGQLKQTGLLGPLRLGVRVPPTQATALAPPPAVAVKVDLVPGTGATKDDLKTGDAHDNPHD